MTGATAAARAIAAGSQGDAEVRSIQEIHGRAQGRPASMTAPFGRRLCEVGANRASGGYRVFSLLDREGPEPLPGQFYMLAAAAGWGGGGGSGPSCRGRSRSPRPAPRGGGVRLDFLVEGVGPGTDRLCALEAGEGVWVTGPLGNAFADAPRGARRAPPGRSSSAAASGSPRWPCCAAASASAACPLRVLLGFRDQAHSGGLDDLFVLPLPEVRLATEDGHAGHRGYVTDLLAAMLAGDDAASRRRLLLRPAGDAGGGAVALRRARRRLRAGAWSRRWPAASAPASAARCRSPTAATCASASTGRWSAATGSPRSPHA